MSHHDWHSGVGDWKSIGDATSAESSGATMEDEEAITARSPEDSPDVYRLVKHHRIGYFHAYF